MIFLLFPPFIIILPDGTVSNYMHLPLPQSERKPLTWPNELDQFG